MNRMESYIRTAMTKPTSGLRGRGEDARRPRRRRRHRAAVAVVAARATASWWDEPVTGIDHEGLDPVEALWRARDTARRTLTDHTIPRNADPFAQGFAVAFIEAARTFYRDTAHLDALTTRTERPNP